MNNNKASRISTLSSRAIELLFELRQLETPSNMQLLAGDLDRINSKLLRLYRATDNVQSHELIADLLSEVGYPWFKCFVEGSRSKANDSYVDAMPAVMSQDKFLNLKPANIQFH